MDDPDGEAMKAYEKVQQNIGQSLSYEKEMQDNRSNIFGFNLRRLAFAISVVQPPELNIHKFIISIIKTSIV